MKIGNTMTNRMKILLRTSLLHTWILAFCAFPGMSAAETAPPPNRLNVFACEPEWAALTEELGGKLVNVFTAIKATQDPHHAVVTPSLVLRAKEAQLLVCTGAELEIGWLPPLVHQSKNPYIQEGQPGHFLAAEQVELLPHPNMDKDDGHSGHDGHDDHAGHQHSSGNPHVHLDPHRVLTIAEALTKRLQIVDIRHRTYYQKRLQYFQEKWRAAIKKWEAQAKGLRGRKVVIHHRDRDYLFAWLGMEIVAELEPKPGHDPTSKQLLATLRDLEQEPADFIIAPSHHSTQAVEWMHKRTQIPILDLTQTVHENEQATDLFSLYDTIIHELNSAQR